MYDIIIIVVDNFACLPYMRIAKSLFTYPTVLLSEMNPIEVSYNNF